MIAMTDLKKMKVAVLAAGSAVGEVGGAERFYDGLVRALRGFGCTVDLVAVPADESTFEKILGNYRQCSELDLSGYDLVISTKAPTYAVRHPNQVLYLVHTTRVFYDMFDTVFPWADENLHAQRRQIHALDTEAMSAIARRFTIGHEVSARLQTFNGLASEALHPPIVTEGLHEGETGDYFFLPGRLHPWKRVDLVVRAVRRSTRPLRLLIAGSGEAEADLRNLAADDPRIVFLGRISDDALANHYANCLAVPFVPAREDYGYVTLEAFASGKAVVTCSDSGEPTHFVVDGESGLICEPTEEALCAALERLLADPAAAQRMGLNGKAKVQSMRWGAVAERLLREGFPGVAWPAASKVAARPARLSRVAVLDMQPIIPAVGGGRIRLLGLYHALGPGIAARYVGTFDWRGERRRSHQITPGLHETDVPLSEEHHAQADALARQSGGKVVIDVAFSSQAHLSPDYLAAVAEAIHWAEVVVFSHPWLYPLVASQLRPEQTVVYDSQNVEGLLRAQILDERNPVERDLLRRVVADEHAVGTRADVVLGCSPEDLEIFQRIYGWSHAKMRVAPNGVMVSSVVPADAAGRAAARARLGLPADALVAMFIGSDYAPNVEAAHFIADALAPACPGVRFAIVGGVGSRVSGRASNLTVTGPVEESVKLDWLHAADLALNPMFSGSGTNIKMFDFMAAGLPVLTTAVGARGISVAGRDCMRVLAGDVPAFRSALSDLAADPALRQRMAEEARACVNENYAWERISEQLGRLLQAAGQWHGKQRPRFSVVIPSYERHGQLDELMACLACQVWRDFEVIVIDQSQMAWPRADVDHGFPLRYVHTDVKGATRARNSGAFLAMGDVIAFTDDDCRPLPDWLQEAVAFFQQPQVVGVEGLIESDRLNDPDWRPVTNIGFEGIGFMTANLFVRAEHFHALGGFDLTFDRPHFREDTDFGWRLQSRGVVPYVRRVRVFHPPQPRALERESSASRARFFEKDALLFAKHPDRYRKLFHAESHWLNTPGFRENFLRGGRKYGVGLSEFEALFKSTPPPTDPAQGQGKIEPGSPNSEI